MGEQEFDDTIIALVGGGGERRHAGAASQVGIGALGDEERDGRRPIAFCCFIKRGRAIEIACIDGRTGGEKQLDHSHMPAAGGVGEWHGPCPVAGRKRSALRKEPPCQRHTSAGRCGEKRGVTFDRGGLRPGSGVTYFEIAAVALGCGRGRGHRR